MEGGRVCSLPKSKCKLMVNKGRFKGGIPWIIVQSLRCSVASSLSSMPGLSCASNKRAEVLLHQAHRISDEQRIQFHR